jgi:hypothetical protein
MKSRGRAETQWAPKVGGYTPSELADVDPRGLPRCVAWLNLTCLNPETATLADLVGANLALGARPTADQQHLRTALRRVLVLDAQCTDAAILAASVTIPAHAIYELPDRVFSAALAAGVTRKAAANERSYLRSAMRWAAASRRFPVVFPRTPAPPNHWRTLVDEIAPKSAGLVRRNNIRRGLILFGTVARELKGDDVLFDELTRADADEILLHCRTVLGDLRGVQSMRYALSQARRQDRGPWSGKTAWDEFYVTTKHGRFPKIALRDVAGSARSRSWEELVALIRDCGLPASLVE